MATRTKVKQSGLNFWYTPRKHGYTYLLNVLVLVLCFESILCKDYCQTDCVYQRCICTDDKVVCHNETRLKQDILDLFPCIKDDVTQVVITGSVIPEVPANFLGSCHKDTSLRLKEMVLLDISNNGITQIHGKSFHCMPKLETLILAHNEWMVDFHTDQTGYFTSLPALKHLDLTNAFDEVWNGTIHIPKLASIFYETDLTKLETLHLAHNEFFSLSESSANSLCSLTSLKTLDLSHNKLSIPALPSVTETDCLENLQKLDLSYNRMQKLPEEFMNKLERLSGLTEVYLGHNDYSCDCSLLDTYNWLFKTKVQIADLDSIVCTDGYHSSYINKTVLELKASDLKCMQLPVQSHTAVRVVTGIIFTVIGVTVIAFAMIHRAHVRKLFVKCRKRLPSLNLRSHSGYNTVEEVSHL